MARTCESDDDSAAPIVPDDNAKAAMTVCMDVASRKPIDLISSHQMNCVRDWGPKSGCKTSVYFHR